MEREVRYCTSSDGVRIAYTIYGEGKPLLFAVPHPTSIELDLDIPEVRAFFEALLPGRKLIRFDTRGIGASQRDVDDISASAYARDIEAVADAAGADVFDIYAGPGRPGHGAIVFASEHPERVGKLVLWTVTPSWNYVPTPVGEAWAALARADWHMAARTSADLLMPRASVEVKKIVTRIYRETLTGETITRLGTGGSDVSALLGTLSVPTLVLHARHDREILTDEVRETAALIPGARFIAIEGDSRFFFLHHELITPLVRSFLGDEVQPKSAAATADGMTAILFADIADSTALTERMGDAAFREKARTLDDALRSIIRDRGGAVIDAKTLGDGVLATFSAASQAIDAALQCGDRANAMDLPLHLGIHAGDVIREEGNVFGGAVNIAARISALSRPGEVLVSRTVADLGRTSAGVTFEDRSEHTLKGIAEPQRVFAVRPASL